MNKSILNITSNALHSILNFSFNVLAIKPTKSNTKIKGDIFPSYENLHIKIFNGVDPKNSVIHEKF